MSDPFILVPDLSGAAGTDAAALVGGLTLTQNGSVDSRYGGRFFNGSGQYFSLTSGQEPLNGDKGVVVVGFGVSLDVGTARSMVSKWNTGGRDYMTYIHPLEAFDWIIGDPFVSFTDLLSTEALSVGETISGAWQYRNDTGHISSEVNGTLDQATVDPNLIPAAGTTDFLVGSGTVSDWFGGLSYIAVATDPGDGTNDRKAFVLDGVLPTGGSITLTVTGGDDITISAANLASAALLEGQLELNTSIGVGNVTVTGGSGCFGLSFADFLETVPVITLSANSLVTAAGTVFSEITTPGDGGTQQVESFTLPPGTDDGTYTATDGTFTTGSVTWNSNAATFEAALRTAGIDASVTGSGTIADPFVVTYDNVGLVPALTDGGGNTLTRPVRARMFDLRSGAPYVPPPSDVSHTGLMLMGVG